MSLNTGIRIFSGTSNPHLADSVCVYLDVPLGRVQIEKFPDGEKWLRISEDVRGSDCFVIQSTCLPVDEHLMELLIFLDCLRRASAQRITAVIPYFGYARQDRKDEGRVPITAKLVANLITTAGADRVLAVDLHANQLQGFFDIPMDHLSGELILCDYFSKRHFEGLTVVSPDVGNMKIAAKYADDLGGDLAIVHKKRLTGDAVEASTLIGDVEDRWVLMVDDIIATAGTVCSAAQMVKERGAKGITIGATHGVFAGPALERLKRAPIDEVVVTDTIPISKEAAKLGNIKVLSCDLMIGEAIRRIYKNESVSSLFKK